MWDVKSRRKYIRRTKADSPPSTAHQLAAVAAAAAAAVSLSNKKTRMKHSSSGKSTSKTRKLSGKKNNFIKQVRK